MKITSRAEAVSMKSPAYFTGRPCKHGHISYRYTQSGTCAHCINGASPGGRHASDEFVKISVRAYDLDKDTLTAVVWASIAVRCPAVGAPRLRASNRAAGTTMYSFKCHRNDVETLRQVSIDILNSRQSDVQVAVLPPMPLLTTTSIAL